MTVAVPGRRAPAPDVLHVETWALAAAASSHLPGATGALAARVGVGVLAVAGLAIAAWLGRRGRVALARAVVGALAVVGLTVVGVLVRTGPLSQTPLAELAEQGGTAAAELLVVSEPRVSGAREGGWWAVVRVGRLGGSEDRSRALLRGDGEPPPLWSRWSGRLHARPLGAEGFDDHLRTLHAVAAVTPAEGGNWTPPGWAGRLTERVRDDVRRAAGPDPSDARALVVGLATGDTRLLSVDAQASLRDAGLSHLTAVSGSNVAILLAAVLLLAATLGLAPRSEAVALVVALAAFALLTRFEPSVLRASAMALAVVAARLRSTLADGRRALAVAVLTLVVVDPMLGRSLGLLLSAAATWGLLVLQPRLRRRMRRLPDRLAAPLSVAVAAQLAVTPLLLLAEGRVRLADVVANVLAVPVAAAASLVGGAGALLAVVRPWLGGPVVGVAAAPAGLVLHIASVVGGRGPAVDAARPFLLVAFTCVAVWLLVAPGGRAARTWAAVALVAGAVARLPIGVWTLPDDALRVTAIDVGQGDAVMVETPDLRLLVDAGGDARAASWLRRHRVEEVDLLVASHQHADHVGGLPDVLDVVDVGHFWHRFLPSDEAAGWQEPVERLASRGVGVSQPAAGQTATWGATTVEVLGPPPAERPYAHSDAEANDSSLVLRVQWQGRSVLLTGDAEVAAQRDLLLRPERLRADVLKVPHHGGATSDPDFIRAVAAPIAIVSVGRGNDYGHPTPELLGLLADAAVRRTDVEGTIVVELGRLVDGPEAADAGSPVAVAASVPASRPWLSSAHVRHPQRPPRRQRRRPPAPARHRGRHRARGRGPPGRRSPRVRGA